MWLEVLLPKGLQGWPEADGWTTLHHICTIYGVTIGTHVTIGIDASIVFSEFFSLSNHMIE